MLAWVASCGAAAGATLLADLRRERVALEIDCADNLVLRAADGDVRIQRSLACTLSGVLRSALSGPYVEGSTGTYELQDHAAATVSSALAFSSVTTRASSTDPTE